ncbi:hypothetical protein RMN57_32615 [Kitasatospora sp. CM 4170]|uniref:Uncharacterized protein n=1 Tax=Kitasatospora aburaviensis TaxID=67265 RepID=A0ABW1FAI2_9ACTN|nr:hypothetical protein [Kitasatospora sp. CM 4170]WNM49101.1 hypothetical protein RMN57_32615 [Kitasatospora sp. CM 4170]
MNGTLTRIGRGNACGITVRHHLPARTSVDGRLRTGILAGPGSTESPHAVRPMPETC